MRTHNATKNFVTGAIIILAGLLFLLHRFEMIPPEVADVIFRWPMILVAGSFTMMIGHKNKVPGLIVLAIGLFFTITHHYDVPEYVGKAFWPALIILFGLMVLMRRPLHRRMHHVRDGIKKEVTNADDNYFEDVAIFGGGNKFFSMNPLLGGRITAIFGGSEIDLSQCELPEEGAEIEVTAVFGGSVIRVPVNWNVRIDVTPILGGVEDKRAPLPSDQLDKKMLVIRGTVVFGGCEIKRS